MALSDEEVAAAIGRGWAKIDADRARLNVYRDYHAGRQMLPRVPVNVDPTMKSLVAKATTNLMRVAVNVPAQMSFVDGFCRVGPAEGEVDLTPPEWEKWVTAGFNAKQTTLFRATLKYGHGFVFVDPVSGLPKILPTRETTAFFADPVNDLVPVFVVTMRDFPTGGSELVFMDDERIVTVPVSAGVRSWSEELLDAEGVEVVRHKMGECPVVRFACETDDEGSTTGVVEPLIPAQDRVNQSAFDLLVNQAYGSFRVRWAAGLTGEPVLDSNGDPVVDQNGFTVTKPVEVSQSRMLMTDDPSARFGTLDSTPVDGFISALDNAVRTFAVLGNIPPHSLLGAMSNLSGETIEAAMGQTNRFVHMLKTSWGESVSEVMRLIRRAWDFEEVTDAQYQVRWRDVSDQSMAQIVDALGKASQMLGVPGEGLWSRIPGVTDADLRRFRSLQVEAFDAEEFDSTDSVGAAARERVALGLFNNGGGAGADSSDGGVSAS